MKITVINGNMRHGSTWNCMDAIVRKIERYEAVERTEFVLPRDMPHQCVGCFFCIYNGEETCPHHASVAPIAEAILNADLVILTSPVYGMDVSGSLKTLLDHLCYMWMSHRPNSKMFSTIGLTVVTTAGVGLKHTTKTMKNSLTFWGVKKCFSLKNAVAAKSWAEVSDKRKAKIEKETEKLAGKLVRAVRDTKKLPNPMFRSFMFKAMTGSMKKNDWNLRDKEHWEQQGWLNGAKPFAHHA
jgi:multimeric flavodoxin WrbA